MMDPALKRFKPNLTLICIDLGSNALRCSIGRTIKDELHFIYHDRVALRLGEDVFTDGFIKDTKKEKTIETFINLFHRCIDFNVTDVKAVATSAMREAQNGEQIRKEIQQITGIKIELISGLKEAELILQACQHEFNFKNKKALLIDIGGGSTELTLISHGIRLASRSFPVGTVRMLQHTNRSHLKSRLETEVSEMIKFISYFHPSKSFDLFIGTGGNLRRIGKMRKKIMGKSETECLYPEINHMSSTLEAMSFIERIRTLELDSNRADVIVPATLLIEALMRKLQLKKIYLPKVGLKEGLFLEYFKNQKIKFSGLN